MNRSTHSQSVQRQLEEILKDTKALCELEPFVKKWSISEVLPIVRPESPSVDKDISGVFLRSNLNSLTDDKERENVFREVKEMMIAKKQYPIQLGNNCNPPSSPSPFESLSTVDTPEVLGDQYDLELNSTLNALQEIEQQAAVTEKDVEEYIRGQGKPDGVDLHKTNTLEWKNIFVEHYLNLNRNRYFSSSPAVAKQDNKMGKPREPLPNIRKVISPRISPTESLHKQFMARKQGNKIAEKDQTGSRPGSSTPEKFLQGYDHAKIKVCSSPASGGHKSHLHSREEKKKETPQAVKGLLPKAKSTKSKQEESVPNSVPPEDYYFQQRQRIKKCMSSNVNLRSDSVIFMKPTATTAKEMIRRVRGKVGNPSIRPSSAIPNTCTKLKRPTK